jgi:hypothetical protein
MAGSNIPTVETGTTPATLSTLTGARQILVENTHNLNSMTVAWNGSVGVWTLRPGRSLGLYVVGGMVDVTLDDAAPPAHATFQVLRFS